VKGWVVDTFGYFINLDRSLKRRRALEAELSRVGLAKNYKRFRAIDGRALNGRKYTIGRAEAGCFLSHLGVLEAGRKGGRHFHILEDDAILCGGFSGHLSTIMTGPIEDFDLIFTEMLVPLDQKFLGQLLMLYEQYVTAGAFNLLVGSYWAGLTSYVVNIRSADKLIDLFRQAVQTKMTSPIDLCLANLVSSGAVKVGCLFPFVSTIGMSHVVETTISRPGHPISESLIIESPRAAFYIEADVGAIKAGLAAVQVRDFRQSLDRSAANTLVDSVSALQARSIRH
jgi:GR25 family glycosyltransferase involved in LPS biosynthesis